MVHLVHLYPSFVRKTVRVIITSLLILCFRLAISIHKPTIIAITGSVGKTGTKNMVTAILKEAGLSVRGSYKNYNSNIGILLSFFGLRTTKNPLVWIYNVVAAFSKALVSIPEYLVVEVGLEEPGDITEVVHWLHPDIAVITLLAEDPVHLENFPSKDALYQEKLKLFDAVREGGCILYNTEDPVQVTFIKKNTKKGSATGFSLNEKLVRDPAIHYSQGKPIGTDVVLSIAGKEEPFYIPETLGIGTVQSLVVAISIIESLACTIPVATIRKAVASRTPTPGRMHILEGYNGGVIIDDTYNASPVAMVNAIETLTSIDAENKVLVLGEMAQLGPKSAEVHKKIGRGIERVEGHVFLIDNAWYGDHPSFHTQCSREEVIEKCKRLMNKNTVVLCKGSRVAKVDMVVSGIL